MKSHIVSAIVVLALTSSLAFAKDKTTITDVGNGRYTCSGDRYKCAQIDQQNRLTSQSESDRYERARQREIDLYNRSSETYDGKGRRTYERE